MRWRTNAWDNFYVSSLCINPKGAKSAQRLSLRTIAYNKFLLTRNLSRFNLCHKPIGIYMIPFHRDKIASYSDEIYHSRGYYFLMHILSPVSIARNNEKDVQHCCQKPWMRCSSPKITHPNLTRSISTLASYPSRVGDYFYFSGSCLKLHLQNL